MKQFLPRLVVWIAISAALSFAVAPNFLSLLDQELNQNFGSVFPAVPFAALLLVLFALRGHELALVLEKEGGFRTESGTRVLGAVAILALFFLRGLTSLSVYSSGVAVILTVYAASLLVNPLTKRIMFPYALIYILGVTTPAFILWALGEPAATFSAALSARMIAASGIPVAWQGTQFALTSKTGDYIMATVTPGCSSAISLTTFLGLLGLMHLDQKKSLGITVKFALIGVAVLTLLNSLRILILVWIGYTSGSDEFWSFHNWIGYALFLGFYIVIMPLYSRVPVATGGGTDMRNWRARLF